MLGAVLLTGCGDEEPGATTSTTAATDGGSAGHGDSEHGEPSPVPDDARHVPVAARSSAFEPAAITVEVGEPIAIVLTAEDALHDFVIDDLDAHVTADAGETAVGGFTADEPGRYAYYCSVEGHREAGMEGTLVVVAAS